MMTDTKTADHATNSPERKQMNYAHFADCSLMLSEYINQSRNLALFATGDRCNDFTAQFLLNQAIRSRRG